MSFALAVLLYSLAVLLLVAWMGDIGVRCAFTTEIKEVIPSDYEWSPSRPNPEDRLVSVGAIQVRHYTDYVRILRDLSSQVGSVVDVSWRDGKTGAIHSAQAKVRYRRSSTYLWSLVWFAQGLVIFMIGARVFWKRPRDESARVFFWLCTLTVGAYMGGYHWTEIVVEPLLIYPFAAFAIFVPVSSLHFYLVFPRKNPTLAAHPRLVWSLLYGIPATYLVVLWVAMGWSRWLAEFAGGAGVEPVLRWIRGLSLGYVGFAAFLFGLSFYCLVMSFRRAQSRSERNQVQWILLASLVSVFLIGYLLRKTLDDPYTLGRDSAAWPMFGVSMLYTVAYAASITRYKLMRVEEIINRSMVYMAFSVGVGLVYSVVLFLSGIFVQNQLLSSNQTSRGAMAAGLAVVVILILSEVARGRSQKVIDRRFSREKYQLDEAMQKMRLAVGSLVDRETLGRRLLEAAADVLRVEWGAIYLGTVGNGPFRLAACHGPEPDVAELAADNPLVERLRSVSGLRVSHTLSLDDPTDAATDAMIHLGGEAASALEAEGALEGLLVLGPKRSGMPYEDEELAFLGALGSVATMALHSAAIQQTLQVLNQELRVKVEKIAEQQRRILLLQDQLTHRQELENRSDQAEDARNVGPSRTPAKLIHSDSAHGGPPSVFEPIRGSGRSVRQMIELARKVAPSSSSVLIRGESGTGKELLAEAIHLASPRANRPLVKVHCAALSSTLLESELFGHVKGAYTNADRDRVGRFEMADGGTLFLDEIGDISLEVQTKLLRVLQEMSFERVGSSQTLHVDLRIIAATHQDLEAFIQAGRFREDLFYRLNVFSLRTPSLRERKDDIFELAIHFLRLHAQRVGKAVTHINEDAFEAMMAYDWPGNIRELENAIERAVVLSESAALTLVDLPSEIRQPSTSLRRKSRVALPSSGLPRGKGATLAKSASTWREPAGEVEPWDAEALAFERQRLVEALDEASQNKSEAARLLGMPRSTFCSKLKKHGLL